MTDSGPEPSPPSRPSPKGGPGDGPSPRGRGNGVGRSVGDEWGIPLDVSSSRAEWLRGEGQCADVVLSSRVRLARNLAGFPFMTKAGRTDRRQILDIARRAVCDAFGADGHIWIDLHQASRLDRRLLVERQLISNQHERGKLSTGEGGPDEPRGVAIAYPGERSSVMVNEEDHLRIQVMRTGLALEETLEQVDAVDDRIEAGVEYAFHPRFGYLTACPTNVGTAARLSVMLHLPALKLTGELEKVKRAADDMSLAVRGFYGEGSEASGDLYQLSNQTTLGKSERILLHEMESEIVPRIVDYERRARNQLLERSRIKIADQAYRAMGMLSHARLLGVPEAMEALSAVRLGVMLGLVDGYETPALNQLMLSIQTAHLQRLVGRELNQEERRIARADLVRTNLCARGGV